MDAMKAKDKNNNPSNCPHFELGYHDDIDQHDCLQCGARVQISGSTRKVVGMSPKESNGRNPEPVGKKNDQGKPRYSLIPEHSLAAIVGVLEHGAAKYGVGNWSYVDNANERYYNAAMRHIQAWWEGEQLDQETNKPHLAHAACCLMFLLSLDSKHKP